MRRRDHLSPHFGYGAGSPEPEPCAHKWRLIDTYFGVDTHECFICGVLKEIEATLQLPFCEAA